LLLTGSAAIDGRGTEAQDNIVGNAASNVLEGRGGDDVLSGRSGKDTLYGGAGNDRLDGGRGADQMLGGAGDDTYFVDDAGDVVNEADTGSSGNDTVYSSVSFDLSDTLHSKGVIEQLQLTGDQAIDATGNSAANVLAGNTAANVLDGKGGNDTLIGSSGADTFKFTTALSATKNVDVISDFVHGIDIIALDHTIFAALTTLGVLNDTAFALNAAVSSTQHIIYNTTTGALSYDPDGNGAAAAVQFATLTNLTLVSASDFLVI
jgi:Ca2+-binding RTX toxin-like protein